MARKRAQFGLDTLMSYLLFAVFLIFTILALTLSGCGSNKDKIKYGLKSDEGTIAELRASEQLTAYLSTDIPAKDVLYGRIDEAKDKFKAGTPFNSVKAKEFLDGHPEVYVGRTYGGFISAIYDYRDDGRVNDVFDAVTKALFYRPLYSKSARDVNSGRLDGIYYSPIISVAYGRQWGFYYGSQNLLSGGIYSSGSAVSAFKQLPTSDMKGLTIALENYLEDASKPAT